MRKILIVLILLSFSKIYAQNSFYIIGDTKEGKKYFISKKLKYSVEYEQTNEESKFNVFYVNDTTLVFVDSTSLYISYDFGRTKIFKCHKPTNTYGHVSCLNENVIYITANQGRIYKTINGGNSWYLVFNAQNFNHIEYDRSGR